MKDQINEAIEWYGEKINEKPATPANKNLFSTTKKSKELNSEKSDIFHSVTAKLLYIAKRARLDIETTVSYLCTRVSRSTEDDWLKLRRVLGFLQSTINDVRIIGADSLQNLFTSLMPLMVCTILICVATPVELCLWGLARFTIDPQSRN